MNLSHNEFKNNNFFIFKIIMYKLQYLLVPMIIKLASSQQCKPFEYNKSVQYNKQGLIADYNSGNIKQTNGLLDLHLTKSLGGTRLSIAESLHYGTIEAKFKISPGTNVVSSFILMAENEDEIDFEFVQNTLNKTNVIQTNYFYKGIPIFDKNAKMTYNDYNFFKLIGMSILLIISYVSTKIYDNTIGLVISFIEDYTGIRLDGRMKKRKRASSRIGILWRIIRTILSVFAQLLDLILMAFTNQTSVFSNIVKDLLKR
jgi:hypothetical protein